MTKKEVQKEKEQSLVTNSGTTDITIASGVGIEGIVGMTSEDINMPYVFLVRDNTKNAKLLDGKNADGGTYYHSVKKTATKDMEVVISYAEKGKAMQKDMKTGNETEVDAWRALMIPTNNLYSPFVFTFKGMNLWYGWKELLSLLVSEGVQAIHSSVIHMTTKEVTTNTGFTNIVPAFEMVRKSTDEEVEAARELTKRFSKNVGKVGDEDINNLEDLDIDQLLGQ